MSHAGDVADHYRFLVQTKVREVDLHGDGKIIINRKFDAQGELAEMVTRDLSGEVPEIEVLQITRNPEVWTWTFIEGKRVVRREIEHYSSPSEVQRKEIFESRSEAGPLDLRTVYHSRNTSALVEKYVRQKGRWQLIEKSDESVVELKKKKGSARKSADASENPTEGYAQCLMKKHGIDHAEAVACVRHADTLPFSPDAPALFSGNYLEPLECEQNGTYYLPSGYRVDLENCQTREARDAIKQATENIAGKMLSCMHSINPRLADLYGIRLSQRRFKLSCAADDARFPNTKMCDTPSNEAECKKEADRFRYLSDGFYNPNRPFELILTGADPIRMKREHDGKPLRDKEVGSIASTIFHESIHACDFHGKALKNRAHGHYPPDFGDVVYGCEALCGGSDHVITYEGCEACVGAKRNSAKHSEHFDKNMAACKRFPRADSIRKLNGPISTQGLVAECLLEEKHNQTKASPLDATATGGGPACKKLAESPVFNKICKSGNPADEDCITRLQAHAAETLMALLRTKEGRKAAAHFELLSTRTPAVQVENGKILVQPSSIITAKDGAGYAELAAIITDGFCAEIGANGGKHTYDEISAILKRYAHADFEGAPKSLKLDTKYNKTIFSYPPDKNIQAALEDIGRSMTKAEKKSAKIHLPTCDAWNDRRQGRRNRILM